MRLLDLLGRPRDNNFNLIRLVAAFAVLVSHSFAVVTGDANSEPLRVSLGVPWGSIAVDVFFVISGLLVTQSMRQGDAAVDFVAARVLRIWPAFFVSVVLTASVAGVLFHRTTTLHSVLGYIAHNSIVPETGWYLKGVFDGNPFGPVFNISLWTLPIEITMYACVLALWVASFAFFARRRLAFDLLILSAALVFGVLHLRVFGRSSIEASSYRLPFMFFVGAASLILAKRITVSWTALAVVLTVVLVAGLASNTAFFMAYSLGLWYVVLSLAHLVTGRILDFNKTGDASYGVYVYAWPVQQALIAKFPTMGVATHIAFSAAIVLTFSAGSWVWIERPALRLKKRFIEWNAKHKAFLPVA